MMVGAPFSSSASVVSSSLVLVSCSALFFELFFDLFLDLQLVQYVVGNETRRNLARRGGSDRLSSSSL